MAVTIQHLLDRYADGLDEADFAAALEVELAGRPRPGAVELTAAEQRLLTGSGMAMEPPPRHPVRQEAQHITALAAESWSATETAHRLGIDPSRVRHRVADRSLYAFRLGRQLRLPRWQFTEHRRLEPLPNLRRILAHVPDGMAPVELARFMSTPQPDLPLAGDSATPRDWLIAGQPASAICQILDSPYAW